MAHCGVVIDTGSRDEGANEKGMAHFIEHLLFKGTRRRKAFHILSRMENVGGELNAYTSKEETFVYASFLHPHYARALELFADILFNSTFPEKEIAREKDVVLDEINAYKDSPSELIFDEFEEMLYNDHALGTNILGSPESVKQFSRAEVQTFVQNHYLSERMIIASVGNISFDKLVKHVQKYFGVVQTSSGQAVRKEFDTYQPQKRSEAKSNYQVHCMLGVPAYSVRDSKKNTLALLSNILGGPGMNSRLNMGVREKYGYCYAIESQYQAYSDSGNFNIYLGTDNGYLDKSVNLIYKILKTLREKKLGTLQLHRAKQQIAGQLALALESNVNEMISIGKSHLFYPKVDSLKQMVDKVERIDASQLLEVANEIFVPDQFSTLIYTASKNGG